MAKTLTFENALSDDRKPVKIDGESTGLLIGGKDVHIEGESSVGGDLKVNQDVQIGGKLDVNGVSASSITGSLSVGGSVVVLGMIITVDDVFDDGDDPTADHQLANKQYVDAQHPVKIVEVTLDESQMNALNSTEITILAAQGAGKVIVPTSGMLFIDRDGSTAQSNSACDLFISWNGGYASNNNIYYIRRFMYNEGGDRIWHLQHYAGETGQSLTAGDNQPLTVKLDSAVTSGSIDSMKIVISYHIYDNS